ncbi:hypothetical protein C8R44DRAFT_784847 [Mycena epipterygia]|nr:hypothetical protein C8R44DRAFT_784847 [Mycena epipterygia]
MLSYSKLLTRQSICGARWRRAISSFPEHPRTLGRRKNAQSSRSRLQNDRKPWNEWDGHAIQPSWDTVPLNDVPHEEPERSNNAQSSRSRLQSDRKRRDPWNERGEYDIQPPSWDSVSMNDVPHEATPERNNNAGPSQSRLQNYRKRRDPWNERGDYDIQLPSWDSVSINNVPHEAIPKRNNNARPSQSRPQTDWKPRNPWKEEDYNIKPSPPEETPPRNLMRYLVSTNEATPEQNDSVQPVQNDWQPRDPWSERETPPGDIMRDVVSTNEATPEQNDNAQPVQNDWQPREPWDERDSDIQPSPWDKTSPKNTVCINNVPQEALVREVLDFVLIGPIYHIRDSTHHGSRVVSLAFFDHDAAHAFYEQATNNNISLHGHRLEFSWGKGLTPRPHSKYSRTLRINDVRGAGAEQILDELLKKSYPIDRFEVRKESGQFDRVYVSLLSAECGREASSHLLKTGIQAHYAPDRCWIAGQNRILGLQNRSRAVVLRDIPQQTSVSELCDQIRDGALDKILLLPHGVAFVHFLQHSAAASFFHHVIYQDFVVNNVRLSAEFLPRTAALPSHLLEHVRKGASRCLVVHRVVDPVILREDCERHGLVERVSICESARRSTVSFMNIAGAVKASQMLPKEVAYCCDGGLSFSQDPCAVPFAADVEKAASLQAQISSLLVPPINTSSTPDEQR